MLDNEQGYNVIIPAALIDELQAIRGQQVIKKQRSKEFIEKATALSHFIQALKLPTGQHNTLIELALQQTLQAEEDALKQGIDIGLSIGGYLDQGEAGEAPAEK